MHQPRTQSAGCSLGVEPLESRRTPATLVNATTVTYTDVDGDSVVIKFSKPVLTEANVTVVCRFDVPFDFTNPTRLQRLNLDVLEQDSLSVSVVAKKKPAGDGLAAVGTVIANNVSLGNLTIDGDVGKIVCGGNVGTLKVDSLGRFGTDNQLIVDKGLLVDLGGDVGSFTVKKDVLGTQLQLLGAPDSAFTLGRVTIGGSLIDSHLRADGRSEKAKIQVKGDVEGGSIRLGNVRSVVIGGSLVGGAEAETGLLSTSDIETLTIKGDIRGGTDDRSGYVDVAAVKKLVIGGSILGGTASGLQSLDRSGAVIGVRFGSITVGGSLVAGIDNVILAFTNNGVIRANQSIDSLLIKGSVEGNASNAAVISAGRSLSGSPQKPTIGVLEVSGSVTRALIIAGINEDGDGVSADAQIGKVTIGGSWTASSMVAGVTSSNGFFGDGNDVKLSGVGVLDDPTVLSGITKVTIKGSAIGSATGGDFFGIVAQQVGGVLVGTSNLPLLPGPGNDNVFVGTATDFKVREIS